jgi:hypothetical protein
MKDQYKKEITKQTVEEVLREVHNPNPHRTLKFHTGRQGYVCFEMALWDRFYPEATKERRIEKEKELNIAIDKYIEDHKYKYQVKSTKDGIQESTENRNRERQGDKDSS